MDPSAIPLVFDPHQRRRARRRALMYDDDRRFLFEWAGAQLLERLDDIKRSFTRALKIGARDQTLLPCPALVMDMHDGHVIGDEENLPFQQASFDLVFSALSLHTVNDLPGALIQIRRALKPDGLMLAAILGGETLYELRQCLQQAEMELSGGLSPRVAPFADKQQMGALMQRAGYALPVVDSEILTATYPSLTKLMHDLRGMGETNMMAERPKTTPPRGLFARAEDIYRQNFSENGLLVARFEVIFLLGWAPHASQQKPLKPGSAQVRLADALQTHETDLPA